LDGNKEKEMKHRVININLTKSIIIIASITLLFFVTYLVLDAFASYKKFSFGGYDVCCKRIRKTNSRMTIDKCIDGTTYHNITTLVIEKEIKNIDGCLPIKVIMP
jgi:hypothetical protein